MLFILKFNTQTIINMMDQLLKDRISKTRNRTRARRAKMIRKSYEFKINYSRLNNSQKEKIRMMFIEAKWLYNHWLAENKIFEADTKIKKVIVRNKNNEFEERELKFLPAKYKQSICQEMKESIYALSQSRKRGHKVGHLKFKREFNTLILNQYGHQGSHEIRDKNKMFIIGLKNTYVNGICQIPKNSEFGEARLIRKPSGYYIHITTYTKPKEMKKGEDNRLESVGLDFGVKEMITTSNGEVFNHTSIQEPEHLKRLQQKLNRSQKGSKNRHKIVQKIKIKYEKMTNKRVDISNKIVHKLFSTYKKIYIQDDNINGWTKKWGKTIHHSILGRIKEKLVQKSAIKVSRFFPSTQLCYKCGHKTKLPLNRRIFQCSECGLIESRDIKAAKIIKMFGEGSLQLPAEYRDVKPVETKTSVRKYSNKFTVIETGKFFDKRN